MEKFNIIRSKSLTSESNYNHEWPTHTTLLHISTPKMEAAGSSPTSVNYCQTTRRHIPKYNPQNQIVMYLKQNKLNSFKISANKSLLGGFQMCLCPRIHPNHCLLNCGTACVFLCGREPLLINAWHSVPSGGRGNSETDEEE